MTDTPDSSSVDGETVPEGGAGTGALPLSPPSAQAGVSVAPDSTEEAAPVTEARTFFGGD